MTIDAFSEYNVMTHDYGAEYGGASGVIVNAVTKSGTNVFRGSGYYYGAGRPLQRHQLLHEAGRPAQAGERQRHRWARASAGRSSGTRRSSFSTPSGSGSRDALDLKFPAEAAPLATSFSDIYDVNLTKYFGRVDYQLTPANNLSFPTIWNPNTGMGEVAEAEQSHPRELSLRAGERDDQQLPVDRRAEQPDAQRGQGEQHR